MRERGGRRGEGKGRGRGKEREAARRGVCGWWVWEVGALFFGGARARCRRGATRNPTQTHLPPHSCVTLGDDDDGTGGEGGAGSVAPTPLGRIASFYYLQHRTLAQLGGAMCGGMDTHAVLLVGRGGGRRREEGGGV